MVKRNIKREVAAYAVKVKYSFDTHKYICINIYILQRLSLLSAQGMHLSTGRRPLQEN